MDFTYVICKIYVKNGERKKHATYVGYISRSTDHRSKTPSLESGTVHTSKKSRPTPELKDLTCSESKEIKIRNKWCEFDMLDNREVVLIFVYLIPLWDVKSAQKTGLKRVFLGTLGFHGGVAVVKWSNIWHTTGCTRRFYVCSGFP